MMIWVARRYGFCSKSAVMILAFGIFISAFGAMGLISRQLSKAPEGFEDEDGFHFTANSDRRVVKGSFRAGPAPQSNAA